MKRLSAGLLNLSVLGMAACASGDVSSEETFNNFETNGDGDGDGDTGDGDGEPGDGDGEPGDGDGEPGDGDGDPSACGNGVIEGSEQCDGGELGGATCASEGFGGGGIQCTDSCTLDTSNCTACGNGSVDDGEECDGDDLGRNSTCADLSLGGVDEPLGCTDSCTYDFGGCSGCGDGVVTEPELCEPAGELLDKAELNGQTCAGLGFDDGLLDCTEGCTFNTASCYSCGDAIQQGQEQCDGADFNEQTCADYDATNGQPFDAGSLSCSGECTIGTANCSLCGDGVISGAEVCDGSALDGETCQTQGLDGGSLGCKADCSGFELANCTDCGDGVIEGNEQCDFNNLGGQTCSSQGFPGGGTLACTLACVLDTSGCSNNFCGDGLVNGMDECDCGNQGQNCTAGQLGNQTCASLGYSGGTLTCNSPNNCNFNENACYECGDGNINPGEQCDGNNLGGQTCASQGFGGGGTLSCSGGCMFNTNACIAVPNPYTICSTPNLAIPDNVTTQAVISINAPGTITDVNLSTNILHTWPGDISYTLSHGVTRTILDRPGVPASTFGCSTDNINATFDDEAAGVAESVCNLNPPAISSPPNYDPVQSLSAFDNTSMSGDWTLSITDHFSPDPGTLVQWCLVVSWQ